MKTRLDIGGGDDAAVQMGPLVDCVFLLLIFFLVTSTLKKAHRELDIRVPFAAAAIQTQSNPETIVVELTRERRLYVNGELIIADVTAEAQWELLHRRLQTLALEDPSRRVRIDLDRTTAYQHLVQVMDVCRTRGLNTIGLRPRH
jgi:biopolymer transport protein ExbD